MVYPLIMLMQTMSAGGMGGGVAAAVARALGAGHRHDAHALVLHALLIACVMGALFTTGALWGGPALYRAMGGTGDVLAAALAYSDVVFAGALSFWLLNTLASVVRGTGNMLPPSGSRDRRRSVDPLSFPSADFWLGAVALLWASPGPAWRSSPTTASGAWYCSPICSLDAVWYG